MQCPQKLFLHTQLRVGSGTAFPSLCYNSNSCTHISVPALSGLLSPAATGAPKARHEAGGSRPLPQVSTFLQSSSKRRGRSKIQPEVRNDFLFINSEHRRASAEQPAAQARQPRLQQPSPPNSRAAQSEGLFSAAQRGGGQLSSRRG